MKIFIANKRGWIRDSFLNQETLLRLHSLGNVEENETEKELTSAELAEKISDAEIVFTGWGCEPITAQILNCAPQLQMHVHVGGSVAAYSSPEEFERGITVLSGNEIFARSVAEGAICYILAALRKLPLYACETKHYGWNKTVLEHQGLLGKTVGMVGYGTISKYLCPMLKAFGVNLKIYSAYDVPVDWAQKCSLNEIFETCDIITLHSAWNARTEGMITGELLSKIKGGALFVNTARAALVDENALYTQLRTGRFNAILDVYHQEPLGTDSPLIKMENVILLPHMAGPTVDMRQVAGEALVEDIGRFLRNEPCQNVVTKEQAARMTIERRKKS